MKQGHQLAEGYLRKGCGELERRSGRDRRESCFLRVRKQAAREWRRLQVYEKAPGIHGHGFKWRPVHFGAQ
jgi:hypothetical protein